MKSPIILEGPAFDWKAGADAADRIQGPSGINWGAAIMADPGVMSCPSCKTHLWCEGHVVRCPECGHEFKTRLHPEERIQ